MAEKRLEAPTVLPAVLLVLGVLTGVSCTAVQGPAAQERYAPESLPASTLTLVDALIEADRDFDLLLLPNRDHFFTHEPYFIRRRWDYFVRHLLGAEPPAGYSLPSR